MTGPQRSQEKALALSAGLERREDPCAPPSALLPLVLAGCLADEAPAAEPVRGAATKDGDTATPAAPVAQSGSAPDEAAAIEAPPEAAPVPVPFTWEGKTGTWSCLPDSPSSCRAPPVQPPSSSDAGYGFEDVEGRVDAVTGTLTWTAVSPATEQLGLGSFEFAAPLAEGRSALLSVFVPPPELPFVYLLSLEQSFTLDGVYTPTP